MRLSRRAAAAVLLFILLFLLSAASNGSALASKCDAQGENSLKADYYSMDMEAVEPGTALYWCRARSGGVHPLQLRPDVTSDAPPGAGMCAANDANWHTIGALWIDSCPYRKPHMIAHNIHAPPVRQCGMSESK